MFRIIFYKSSTFVYISHGSVYKTELIVSLSLSLSFSLTVSKHLSLSFFVSQPGDGVLGGRHAHGRRSRN